MTPSAQRPWLVLAGLILGAGLMACTSQADVLRPLCGEQAAVIRAGWKILAAPVAGETTQAKAAREAWLAASGQSTRDYDDCCARVVSITPSGR